MATCEVTSAGLVLERTSRESRQCERTSIRDNHAMRSGPRARMPGNACARGPRWPAHAYGNAHGAAPSACSARCGPHLDGRPLASALAAARRHLRPRRLREVAAVRPPERALPGHAAKGTAARVTPMRRLSCVRAAACARALGPRGSHERGRAQAHRRLSGYIEACTRDLTPLLSTPYSTGRRAALRQSARRVVRDRHVDAQSQPPVGNGGRVGHGLERYGLVLAASMAGCVVSSLAAEPPAVRCARARAVVP